MDVGKIVQLTENNAVDLPYIKVTMREALGLNGWFTDTPTLGHYWAYNERYPNLVELIEVVNDRGGLFARLRSSIVRLSEFTHFKVADIPEPPKVEHAKQ